MAKAIAITTSMQLLAVLIVFEVLLVLMHFYQADTGRLTTLFNLDVDGKTVGQWFSASQLFCVGALSCLTAKFVKPPKWPPPALMMAVGLSFIFLAADEALGFHETITRYTVSYDWIPRFEGDHGVWIFVYGLIGLLVIAFTQRYIQKYIRLMMLYHSRQLLMIATGLATFITGGVGLEVADYYSLFEDADIQIALEEFLEMFGISIVLAGLLEFFFHAVEQQLY
jgi:hypothetical protein